MAASAREKAGLETAIAVDLSGPQEPIVGVDLLLRAVWHAVQHGSWCAGALVMLLLYVMLVILTLKAAIAVLHPIAANR